MQWGEPDIPAPAKSMAAVHRAQSDGQGSRGKAKSTAAKKSGERDNPVTAKFPAAVHRAQSDGQDIPALAKSPEEVLPGRWDVRDTPERAKFVAVDRRARDLRRLPRRNRSLCR